MGGAAAYLLVLREEGDDVVCDLGRDNEQDIIGHDVGVSSVLPDGRVLFLFGDTWVGPITDGVRDIQSQTSNSGALLPDGEPICGEALEHLTDAEGNVRQLIPLMPGDDAERIAYWPIDSVIQGDRILTYYRRVDRGDSLRTLQFEVLGTGVASASLDTLEYTLENDGEPIFEANEHVAAAELNPEDGLVYVLICRQDGGEDIFAPCVAGRAPPASMADEDAYEFYSGGMWTSEIDDAELVLQNGESEMTLNTVERGGGVQWVATYVPPFTCEIVVQFAPDPWGPYSEPEPVYEGDPEDDGGSRCYGGKFHPEFSSDGRGTFTWVSSGTLTETLENPDTYWPHVVEVDVD